MASPRGNPFDEIEDLFERMSREFEGAVPGTSSVAVDVVDRGDEYVVTADLPGFEKADIEATLADRTLRIEATRSEDVTVEGEFVRRERRRESASRSVTVPEAVDEEGIAATFENGVLEVRLPKRGSGGGTSIEVE